ncbi:MAG: DNA polymerase I [Alphaproteobacteria bacterium]|jgi:DNA polymerase-1|nr:DNA polymerase I [Alphaproteobacteria bacterium]MDP7222197.1 DNA polymerase I [Alphaproteobacteria bacterium]
MTKNATDTSANTDKTQDTRNDVAEDELFLVDGSGYIFRAYYAVPQTLTNPKGVPVGAVMGFTNMLMKLLNDLHAPYIAVIFDAARKNFRNDIYEEYKANRDDTPEDLKPQFGLIREATKAFDIPAIEMDGYEADDLIATYARIAVEQGKKVTIVGTDKDLMQLVTDDIRLYDPIKGQYIGRDGVVEKFGAPPEKVIDIQALAGDSVDNVPGVPGIGIKTAVQLLEEFGTLEELLDRADEIPQPKRREKLIDHADDARISKQLVTLDKHVDVNVPLEKFKARDMGSPKLAQFLKDQGFNSILARVKASPDIETGDITDDDTTATDADAQTLQPISKNEYTLIQDEATLQQWIDACFQSGTACIDTETTNLTPRKATLVGISLSYEIGKAAYIPLAHNMPKKDLFDMDDGADEIKQIDKDKALALLKPLLEDKAVIKIAHNAKYDWQMFYKHGVEVFPIDDTLLISYVLDGSSRSHSMDNLSAQYFGHAPIKYEEVAGKGKNQITFDLVPLDKACDYAAEDADITLRLYHTLKPRLAAEKMTGVYEDIERPIIPVIAKMEYEGIKVDPLILKNMSSDFEKQLIELEKEIHADADTTFNIASPKQVGQILFDQMGIEGGKKTKNGDWSTSADILEKLAAQGYKIVDKILHWRQLSKLKSTYTDALQTDIVPETGRVHTSFHMSGTSTGRLSSSDPNLQNIPIRTDEGRKIRTAFVAEDGCTLLAVDYSQVELRLAAEIANVAALKQAFKDKVDIHTLTASQVFGVPLDDVSPELRRQAKAVNFGIIYGISGWGLAKQLGCEPGDANEFIRKYLAKFNEIQDYMERAKDEARQYGFVRTLYGRKCMIPYIKDKIHARKQGAERQAINAPLQGTAADIMKIAMADIPPALVKEGLSAKMLLQVHDELIFEVPDDELEKTKALVIKLMENIAKLDVPLVAEAGTGHSWAEAH